jgi:hypothetical protein
LELGSRSELDLPHVNLIIFLACEINYADVLGHVIYVGELEEVWKKSRRIEICNARIRNLR